MHRRYSLALSCALLLACSSLAVAQQKTPTDVTVVGHVYEPARLSPTDARVRALRTPEGFVVQRFAEGLENPRMLAVSADGTVYVTQRKPGNVILLRDLDGDGVADIQRVALRLPQAHGIAIRGQDVYVADVKRVYVGTLQSDGTIGPLRTLLRDLPDGGQHPNRTLGFSPDGELFVSVGSTCNECRETNPENATLLRAVDTAPRGREVFASGLRNTIGFGWHPLSKQLFGMDHGIDWLGDNAQSEELNQIKAKTRYGWPYVYDEDQFNPHSEPQELTLAQWARLSEEPVGLYTPHSAPMQMAFYTSRQFPAAYRNDAFIAMRGSWNTKPPTGYEVVRAHFNADVSFASFDAFVTGFLEEQSDGSFGYFARPVGTAIDAAGALLVADDTNNTLYRIAYDAAPALGAPQQLASELFAAAPATLRVTSDAFANGGAIPTIHSDYGRGASPPLAWSGVPANARSLVLMMEDPDALAPLPFVHWTAINIGPQSRSLPAGIVERYAPPRPSDVKQGANSTSRTGYFGPRPPPGDPAHHYHFQLFALDTTLDLPIGFNRQSLLKAMQGHVLARGELIGLYRRPE